MRFLLPILFIVIASTGIAQRSTRVRGGFTKQGTYRQPHARTSPNHSKMDNYSTKGNTNPYTGKSGTKAPFALPRSSKK
jgi:hypothetical protein